MPYQEEFNAFASQNPGDAYAQQAIPQQETQGDPLLNGGADAGTRAPAPAAQGLTGDPFQTMQITTAQLAALRPRQRRALPQRPALQQPMFGLSQSLGG